MATSNTEQWQCLNCKEVFPNFDALPQHVCGDDDGSSISQKRGPFLPLPKPEFTTGPEEEKQQLQQQPQEQPINHIDDYGTDKDGDEGDEEEDNHVYNDEDQLPRRRKQSTFFWTDKGTQTLLEIYRQHPPIKNDTMRKIDGWRKISQLMSQRNFKYSEEICHRKFRSLKLRLRTIYLANAKKRYSQRSKWPYFDIMKELCKNDSYIKKIDSGILSDYQCDYPYLNPCPEAQPREFPQQKPVASSSFSGEREGETYPPSPSNPTHESPSKTNGAKEKNKHGEEEDESNILDFIKQQSKRMDEVVKVASQRNTTLQKLMTEILIQQQQFQQSQQELQRQQQQMMVQLQQQQLTMMQLMQQQFQERVQSQNKTNKTQKRRF